MAATRQLLTAASAALATLLVQLLLPLACRVGAALGLRFFMGDLRAHAAHRAGDRLMRSFGIDLSGWHQRINSGEGHLSLILGVATACGCGHSGVRWHVRAVRALNTKNAYRSGGVVPSLHSGCALPPAALWVLCVRARVCALRRSERFSQSAVGAASCAILP